MHKHTHRHGLRAHGFFLPVLLTPLVLLLPSVQESEAQMEVMDQSRVCMEMEFGGLNVFLRHVCVVFWVWNELLMIGK